MHWQTGDINPPRCECHECTQAPYRQSLQGQLDAAIKASIPVPLGDRVIGQNET